MVSATGGISALSGSMGERVDRFGLKMFYGATGSMSDYLRDVAINDDEELDYKEFILSAYTGSLSPIIQTKYIIGSKNMNKLTSMISWSKSSSKFMSDMINPIPSAVYNGFVNGLYKHSNSIDSCTYSPIKKDHSFPYDNGIYDITGGAAIGVW